MPNPEMNDRMWEILVFMVGHQMWMPPAVVHENLTARGATWSIDTTRRHLKALQRRGYLKKTADDRAFYRFTGSGKARVEETETDLSRFGAYVPDRINAFAIGATE